MVTTKQTTTKAGGKTTGVIRQEKTVKGKTVEKKTRAKTQGDRKKVPATFQLEAPQAEEVFIAGCFNGWDPAGDPLIRDQEGTWRCTLAMEPGMHEYRFVVDGIWCDDPANAERCWNMFGTENCICTIRS